jgi:hypothetical protein
MGYSVDPLKRNLPLGQHETSCCGIEPQLRKLKLEYGNSVEIEYRMGGLLKDCSYNSGFKKLAV